ncbi:MAG: DegT/DnrJ/EryC1/StrS family aminotransferase [Cyanobacteria bacterium J069]|nr:MAG: DegT/DnrJ/EryC1/StrS family aminotransferase [Cyanobacteria bacterium J069]
MNSIPPLDLTQQFKTISAEVNEAVLGVLASGQYINGPVVQRFEQAFADYIGTSEAIACNSGTDALYLALRAYDIGAGDEVITTPFTFIASAETVSQAQATPVFVDIDPVTFNLDLDQVEAAITPRTKAIIPVHLFGQPVDMTRLMAIAQAHNLIVIEDSAQAAGAEWNGQRVGSIGHVGCFSFFPTKNLGACGDGGAVTTSNPAIAARIRALREHGSHTRYYHDEIGLTSRLDAVQAAILEVKLRHLETWNEQRRAIAARYTELLAPVPGVMPPHPVPGGKSVWHQYTIRLSPLPEGTVGGEYRDRVRQSMQQQGVSSMIYYPLPLHLQAVYKPLGYGAGAFPVTEQVCHEVLSLPMFPELAPEQQEQVVYALKDSLKV